MSVVAHKKSKVVKITDNSDTSIIDVDDITIYEKGQILCLFRTNEAMQVSAVDKGTSQIHVVREIGEKVKGSKKIKKDDEIYVIGSLSGVDYTK